MPTTTTNVKSPIPVPLRPPPITQPKLPYPEVTKKEVKDGALELFQKPLMRLGTPLVLPPGYEFVILTGLSSVALLTWKARKVSEAREKFKVPHPQTYSERWKTFNCIHRAQQSTLEIYPQFLFLLLIGGLEMPYFSTIGGLIWLLGRYIYAKGYYTGDPRNRANGSFFFVGQWMLLFSTCKFALRRFLSRST